MAAESMQLDIAALQKRLRDAGLDDSLPSTATPVALAAAAPAAAPAEDAKATKKAEADKFVAELEAEDRTPEEIAAVKAAAASMDIETVGVLKAEGNESFRKGEYKEACESYLQAIRMLDRGEMADAKLLSNMAAAQLALDKYVAAAMYGQRSVEADADWWKGHWYRGQALMKMLRNKPPSTAMSERCEQAKLAFEGCLKTTTLPETKKQQVQVLSRLGACASARREQRNVPLRLIPFIGAGAVLCMQVADELQACKNALMQMTGCANQ
jgi:tetratricopeptide (TPR) repeat protein